jgi:hypothetical protein
MSKNKLIAALCFASLSAFAGDPVIDQSEDSKSVPSYYISADLPDKTLDQNVAAVVFKFNQSDGKTAEKPVKYSVNGINKTWEPSVAGKRELLLRPGKYVFRFWFDENNYEITTDSILVRNGYHMELQVNFKRSDMLMICDKPVIYLYPQQTMKVDVQLEPKGKFLFTYPEYNKGWSVTADPDGSMQTGNKTYNYLFWDGVVDMDVRKMDLHRSFEVRKENLVKFFEDKLAQMGLNAKETEDYITYWVPRMNANEVNIIHFIFNEEYDAYAKLKVTPQPDHLFRVFMIWQKGDEESTMEYKGQDLPSFERGGFTVVEWGGAEVKRIPNPE